MDENNKIEIKNLLRKSEDLFAWDTEHVHGIKRDVIKHSINDLMQKLRLIRDERKVVFQEINKLKSLGFIIEVYYLEWFANIVTIRKSIGRWRMCVAFMHFNSACSKDNYSLPNIDKLIVVLGMNYKILWMLILGIIKSR